MQTNYFSFELSTGKTLSGPLNLYQARNGSIVLVMAGGHTALTAQQIKDLHLESHLYHLADFSTEDFVKFYGGDFVLLGIDDEPIANMDDITKPLLDAIGSKYDVKTDTAKLELCFYNDTPKGRTYEFRMESQCHLNGVTFTLKSK